MVVVLVAMNLRLVIENSLKVSFMHMTQWLGSFNMP
jgi:hypothetical protein